jgi:hypothetical protein
MPEMLNSPGLGASWIDCRVMHVGGSSAGSNQPRCLVGPARPPSGRSAPYSTSTVSPPEIASESQPTVVSQPEPEPRPERPSPRDGPTGLAAGSGLVAGSLVDPAGARERSPEFRAPRAQARCAPPPAARAAVQAARAPARDACSPGRRAVLRQPDDFENGRGVHCSHHVGDVDAAIHRDGRARAERPSAELAHLRQLGRRAQAEGSKDPRRFGQEEVEVRSLGSCGLSAHANECRHADRTAHSLAGQTSHEVGYRLRAAHVRARGAIDRDHADGGDRRRRSRSRATERAVGIDLRGRPCRRGRSRGHPAGALRPRPAAAARASRDDV